METEVVGTRPHLLDIEAPCNHHDRCMGPLEVHGEAMEAYVVFVLQVPIHADQGMKATHTAPLQGPSEVQVWIELRRNASCSFLFKFKVGRLIPLTGRRTDQPPLSAPRGEEGPIQFIA